MKVVVHQTDPVLLDIKANLEEITDKINQGKQKGAALIVFPELALTGYFVGQRYHEAALRLDSPEINALAAATRGTAAVVGFIEESPSMNFYNSALVAVDGQILYACRKLNLPNYGVFEERKIFSPGKRVRIFRLQEFNVAVFICNDLWHPALPYLGVCQKADLLITVFNSADRSMGHYFSNIETWGIINTFYSRIFGIYNICANRVGREGLTDRRDLDYQSQRSAGPTEADREEFESYRFWGGSEIVDPFGRTIAKAALYEPDEISAEIERDLLRQKKILLPYLRNDDPYFTHRELEWILFKKNLKGMQQS